MIHAHIISGKLQVITIIVFIIIFQQSILTNKPFINTLKANHFYIPSIIQYTIFKLSLFPGTNYS